MLVSFGNVPALHSIHNNSLAYLSGTFAFLHQNLSLITCMYVMPVCVCNVSLNSVYILIVGQILVLWSLSGFQWLPSFILYSGHFIEIKFDFYWFDL